MKNFRNHMSNASLSLSRRFSSFWFDIRGVAAVEFAMIAPLLILMFVGTIEISLAIAIDRKVSRIATTIADQITRAQDSIDTNFLDGVFEISSRIMFPYDDKVQIIVSGIQVEDGVARVVWSRGSDENPGLPVDSIYELPDAINVDGSFLIASQAITEHTPAIGFFEFGNGIFKFDDSPMTFSETMYMRPRRTATQTCTDCNPAS